MKHKTSPVYVAVFLYRFAFLLFAVPLQAVLFEGLPPGRAVYIYRLDIFILTFLCVWAVVCFRSIRYSTDGDLLKSKKGVFFLQKNQIFLNTFDSLQVTENLIFRLFKVCKVQTTASKNKATLYLSRKDTNNLTNFFCPDKNQKSEKLNSDLISVLIFSVGFSGALTGLLSAIPLLRNIAGLIGENNTQNFLANADLWLYIGYTALPPFLRTLSTLFLWAWAVGAFVELNRYLNLNTYFYNDRIITCHGFFTKYLSILRKNAISSIVLKQSILLYFLRRYTVQAHLPAEKKEISVPLLLACKKEKCKALFFSTEFPQNSKTSPCVKPSVSSLWGYVWKPLLFLSIVSLLCIGIDILTPYRPEIHLILFITLWGCVWFLFSAAAHRYSALFWDSRGLIIRTAKNLSFIEAHIPSDKIRTVKITQNIFQKRKGVCNLYVYIRSRRSQRFLIKHIDKNKTAQLTVK